MSISEAFKSAKHAVTSHVKDVWKPMEGDVFSSRQNINKLGMRILHVAFAALGLTALFVGFLKAVAIIPVILVSTIVLAACVGAGVGLVMNFFPEQIKTLVDAVSKKITELRS